MMAYEGIQTILTDDTKPSEHRDQGIQSHVVKQVTGFGLLNALRLRKLGALTRPRITQDQFAPRFGFQLYATGRASIVRPEGIAGTDKRY